MIDGLSEEICTLCDQNLTDFCNFKQKVLDLQNGLMKFFAQSKSIGSEIGEIWIKAEKLEDSICKIEQESQSEILDFSSGYCFGMLLKARKIHET